MEDYQEEDYSQDDSNYHAFSGATKKSNTLPFWGNQATMNLNPLILTNIQTSPYFKETLKTVKTYHEVVDEIYYRVNHLEPWERGSRSTANQTGMCGGVRGVGAGGIVSSAFCLLYKLSVLRLTRNQVTGLLNHADSPYIRGLGFMYIRFTQPPHDLWEWYEPYFEDDEVIDVKAGGGKEMTIGDMVKAFLTRLEWFDTRFPRIPVNTQKHIDQLMTDRFSQMRQQWADEGSRRSSLARDDRREIHSASRDDRKPRSSSRDDRREDMRADKRHRSRDREEKRRRSRDRERRRSRSREERRRSRSRNRDAKRRSRSRSREERRRSRSRDRHSHKIQRRSDDDDRESERRKKSKKHKRSRSRSRDRNRDRNGSRRN